MKFIKIFMIMFILGTGIFFITPDQKASAASTKTTAIQKAMKELYATEPYTRKIKIYSRYNKTKTGTEYVDLYESNSYTHHRVASYKFIKKYGQSRLYKYDDLEVKFYLVKVYSLSAGKNSKALSNNKAATLLNKIKTEGKKGKTINTKNLKVGTSVQNVKKQLGKSQKVTVPYTNVVYSYPNSKIYLDSVITTNNWTVDTNGSIRMIQIYQPKNQFLTYGQIKKKFGKAKLLYDRTLGLHFIRYKYGPYSINFVSTRYNEFQYQTSTNIIELNDQLKFNSYVIGYTK
ncbi:DUF4309 domain-containing protein [Kurthia gibsonii]|uniref:DUF4309 domain-containing protein n=1 Tax=Kurthia gibsonii TaxID=33946 RepID=UPI0011413E39|nr:DUF4309 domain-containing protein [Kurthia gibsonii]GED18942.1 hypothetical protein KGI01_06830 [Kurthia gibsonii]